MYKNAVVFPGQGSQSVGMLSDVINEFSIAKETLQQANEVLGFALSDIILNGPAESLNSTNNTQPALVAVEVATWRALNGKYQPTLWLAIVLVNILRWYVPARYDSKMRSCWFDVVVS